MKRRKPLARSTKPLKRSELPTRSGWLKRGKKPRPISDKKRAELTKRTRLRRQVIRRDGERCRAAECWWEVPCSGSLELDEIVSRARWPGGQTVLGNLQLLCWRHNRAKEDYPEKALALGLARNSWERP